MNLALQYTHGPDDAHKLKNDKGKASVIVDSNSFADGWISEAKAVHGQMCRSAGTTKCDGT